MYRVLVYPNITYQASLRKDSYVVVIYNILTALSKVRSDIYWVLLLPKPAFPIFQGMENVECRPVTYPSYPNSMRLHFNFFELMEQINWKQEDYDIVYSHLPEHTLQLKNLFYNATNLQPLFVGYTHWSEVPEITNYPANVLSINLLGLHAMGRCGINTEAQKQLILENAEHYFNSNFIEELDHILEPQYLGWEEPPGGKGKGWKEGMKKVVVFNHRPHRYKNYDWFLRMMDRLWKRRKDFEVWVPLADKQEREYMTIDKYSRMGYFDKLARCYVGVGGEQKYAGWSVSVTDGMSVGVPYLLYEGDYYYELAEEAAIYYAEDDDFLGLIGELLDDPDLRAAWSKRAKVRYRRCKWEEAVKPISKMFDQVMRKLPVVSRTESYKNMVEFINRQGFVTKAELLEHMRWGKIPFSSYRNRLRQDGILIHPDGYGVKGTRPRRKRGRGVATYQGDLGLI